MAEAQAILLRNFRVGGSKPDACAQWLTEITRALFQPIPFREVFVILALFLPQLTFAEGAKLEGRLWYSPIVSSEVSKVSRFCLALKGSSICLPRPTSSEF